MKKLLLGILTILVMAFCGLSQPTDRYIEKLDAFDNPPNAFSSEKELKQHLLVDESHDYVASKNKFFVCLSRHPTSNATRERVSCWYREPASEKLTRVWDICLQDAGPIRFEYDVKTTRLSLIAVANIKVANTRFMGQPVASVVLSVLALR